MSLSACSTKPSADELIESARKHLDNAEPAAAAIQLKHALDRQPGSAPARLLLGKALMAQGDAAGAILELQRARDGGVAAEQVVLELARAHAMAGQRGQAKALLGDAPLTGAEAKAKAKTMLAEMVLTQGVAARPGGDAANSMSIWTRSLPEDRSKPGGGVPYL